MPLDVYFDDTGWLRARPGSKLEVIHQPLPEASTQAVIRPYSAILHTNAGPHHTRWQSLVAYMRRTDITIESHFQVPKGSEEGNAAIVQLMPVTRRADCNAKANQWWVGNEPRGAVSFETADDGYTSSALGYYDLGQLHAIVQTCAALSVKYGIPAMIPGTWDGRGIGWHSLHKEWSIYQGKTCPGPQKISQHAWIVGEVGRLACREQFGR